MTDSRILPGARARLVDANGVTTREFYDFFRRLQDAEETIAEIRQIAEALGSPDGDPANIPPLGFVSDSAQITGGVGVNVTGTLADGIVNVRLAELADSGEGQPLAITRDSYGRVSGSRALLPSDLPDPLAIYLVDENGDYLTDESGSLLSAGQPLVFVGSADDLPAPVAGVITLEGNVCYFITTTVDLAGARLVCGPNTCIRGTSSETSWLKSTGLVGSPLISSAWTLPMKDISITADIALDLDASANAGQALDWFAVNFVDCNKVGTIKSYTNFIQNDSAFVNSGELVFDGTIGTIGFFQSIFTGVAGDNIIRLPSTLTVTRRFRILYSSLIVPSTGAGLSVSASATIPVESYILDTVNFSGAGTYLAGVLTASNTALFQNCKGIVNTAANGQMYMQGNATATTVALTNTFYKVAGTTTASADNAKFTHTSNRLTCDAVVARKYLLVCSLSFNSGNADVCQFGFYDSTLAAVRTPSRTKATANASGRAENVTFQCVTTLQQGDFIEVWAANTSSATNITVDELNVTITEL